MKEINLLSYVFGILGEKKILNNSPFNKICFLRWTQFPEVN